MQLLRHLNIDTILSSDNVMAHMDADDIKCVGEHVLRGYQADKESRAEWEADYADALKLAMQLREEKTFPWQGSSNIKFPLITIAALQYHARAYPALVRGTRPISCRTIGADPTGQKTARAKRISEHMSFQVMEEDCGWEENTDKAQIVKAIFGCSFKKIYFDGVRKTPISELVLPSDLVINYWSKSFDATPRMTHVIPFWPNDLEERKRRGLFMCLNPDTETVSGAAGAARYPESTSNPKGDVIRSAEDDISGMRPGSADEATPFNLLEQHLWLDMDGDGYAEPYIASVNEETGEMYRLVARFEAERIERNSDNQIIRIEPEKYFAQDVFIPSPDGGIYGMGFGRLLGATNHAIDTIINQLTDAGTMSNLGGGFLARGIRVRGGEYSFRPQEWKRTDTTPEDLQKGIYPLPIREPSNVLFQLLGLLIDWGSRIGMSTDSMSGQNPGQNQKVGTTQAVIEQGEKVFNGIYKRSYRALKEEFRLIYRLNYLNPPPDGVFHYTGTDGQGADAQWTDYLESDKTVIPTADPTIASTEQRVQRYMLASQLPGTDKLYLSRKILEEMDMPEIERVMTQQSMQPQKPKEVMVQEMKNQQKSAEVQGRLQVKAMDIMEKAKKNRAQIILLEAQAAKIMSEIQTAETAQMLQLIQAEVAQAKAYQDHLDQITKLAGVTQQANQPQGEADGNSQQGAVGGMAG